MSYEKLYLKMCKESGHKRFIPTQAILDSADKELQAKNKEISKLKEGMAQIVKAVEDCNWGWDGDCGISGKIDFIIDELTNQQGEIG